MRGKKFLGACFFDFLPFQVAPKILLRKNTKKSAKIKDFGFPNPLRNSPKIHPKVMPQNTCNFSTIFVRFFSFVQSSVPLKYAFYLGKITIFKVFAKFAFLHFACIFGQQNLPKIHPKRRPNPSKIDAKNVLFVNIDFFRFRPRFLRALGLQLGAKWAIWASKL